MSIIKKFIALILKKIHRFNFTPVNLSIFIENALSFLRGKSHRYSYQKKENSFLVTEGNSKILFKNKVRGFSVYRNGINNRGNFLFSSYCLDKISFDRNDVVIDCGANYGDLMLKLKNYINVENYVALEPNPSDFEVLKLNYSNSTLINKALGKSNNILPFYVSTEQGDSSLVKPKGFSEEIEVQVVTLDSLINDLNIHKVKLLKVEAEGYEPEILEGTGSNLKKIQYVAVDGGYERGENNEQTFTNVTNFLIKSGFNILDINFSQYRALFINKYF